MPDPINRGEASSPAADAELVTRSDTVKIKPGCRGLYIGQTGNLRVEMAEGGDILFENVPVGVLPIRVIQVYLTNTTADKIIALY